MTRPVRVLLTALHGVRPLAASGDERRFEDFFRALAFAIDAGQDAARSLRLPHPNATRDDAVLWFEDAVGGDGAIAVLEAQLLFAASLLAASADGPFPLIGSSVICDGPGYRKLHPSLLRLDAQELALHRRWRLPSEHVFSPALHRAWQLVDRRGWEDSALPGALLVASPTIGEERLRVALDELTGAPAVIRPAADVAVTSSGAPALCVCDHLAQVVAFGRRHGPLTTGVVARLVEGTEAEIERLRAAWDAEEPGDERGRARALSSLEGVRACLLSEAPDPGTGTTPRA